MRRIDIDGELPQLLQSALKLRSGDPAVAAQVLAAGERLQTALEDEGFAFAKVDLPIAHEDPANDVLDVSFAELQDPSTISAAYRHMSLTCVRRWIKKALMPALQFCIRSPAPN